MNFGKHIYFFKYEETQSDLCKLESEMLFQKKEENRILFSDIAFAPEYSPYIKRRMAVEVFADSYTHFLEQIKALNICKEGFKVEYIITHNDSTPYADRLNCVRDIGYRITGFPQYKKATTTYGICHYKGYWFFGELLTDALEWHKHRSKPRSYSNSINGHIAKALVNIAAKGVKNTHLLDACCGVGTILLEACFAEHRIEGCDINWKVCQDAKQNLQHFNYFAPVHHTDIAELNTSYNAVIIDLPYNLYSTASEADVLHILQSSAQLAKRIIIVSIINLSELISEVGLTVSHHCAVGKYGKKSFERQIWICEK